MEKNLFLNSMKRKLAPTIVTGIVYLAILIVLMIKTNAESIMDYRINPYQYGGDLADFLFGLFVSVPFAISTFAYRKNGFLKYAQVRAYKKNYIKTYLGATLFMCFVMVFIVNMIAIIFSCTIADLNSGPPVGSRLENEILGDMQMNQPVLFGVLWSLFKAFIGTLICLFSQLFALYIKNRFLALMAPYAYVVLENFGCSIIGLPQISLTTLFALNRLDPAISGIETHLIALVIFILVIFGTFILLRKCNEDFY